MKYNGYIGQVQHRARLSLIACLKLAVQNPCLRRNEESKG